MKAIQRTLIVGVCCFLTVGCVSFPESLCTDEDAVIDTRLIGKWSSVDPRDRFTCTFSANETMKSLEIAEPSQKNPDIVQTIRIGDRDFMSGQIKDDKEGRVTWEIFQYKFVSNDEVHVFMMDEAKVIKEIRAGRLAGKVLKRTDTLFGIIKFKPVDVLGDMTTDRTALREYLKAHPDTCFETKPINVLKRQSNPEEK